jgi:hypothetical protein
MKRRSKPLLSGSSNRGPFFKCFSNKNRPEPEVRLKRQLRARSQRNRGTPREHLPRAWSSLRSTAVVARWSFARGAFLCGRRTRLHQRCIPSSGMARPTSPPGRLSALRGRTRSSNDQAAAPTLRSKKVNRTGIPEASTCRSVHNSLEHHLSSNLPRVLCEPILRASQMTSHTTQ